MEDQFDYKLLTVTSLWDIHLIIYIRAGLRWWRCERKDGWITDQLFISFLHFSSSYLLLISFSFLDLDCHYSIQPQKRLVLEISWGTKWIICHLLLLFVTILVIIACHQFVINHSHLIYLWIIGWSWSIICVGWFNILSFSHVTFSSESN